MIVRCGKDNFKDIVLVVFGDANVVSGIKPEKESIESSKHYQAINLQDDEIPQNGLVNGVLQHTYTI